MLLLALVTRCWWFGDPAVQMDEQFYLLVGDRMLNGAVPYIDIWDRKPIGLFLLFAAIRLLGGDGIVQYQAVATLFAATTAWLVVRIARRMTSPLAARLAGALSLIFTIVFDGAGGQSPVFYNPLLAGAALAILGLTIGEDHSLRRITRAGALAMGLIGVAIQIKYTALFEGMTMGLVLLWTARRWGHSSRLMLLAPFWMCVAMLPTALALAAYALTGHAGTFVYANFLSIGDRPGTGAPDLARRLLVVFALGLPLISAAAFALRVRISGEEAKAARTFLIVWSVGAIIGFFAIGSLFEHYFLPVVPPLAALAAPALEVRRREAWKPLVVLATGVVIAAGISAYRARVRGGRAQIERMVVAIRPHLGKHLFVFDGDPILYHLTGAGLVSAYTFPNHLNDGNEAPAIGIDQAAEVSRVMASMPSVVVTTNLPARGRNPVTWEIVRGALAHDYRLVARVKVRHRWRLIYGRTAIRRNTGSQAFDTLSNPRFNYKAK